jgi:type II secretory pathway component GspD/PulD (secretin)
MARGAIWAVAAALVLLPSTLMRAEEAAKPEETTRTIKLQSASAADVARQFAKADTAAGVPDRLREERRDFLSRAMADATRGVRPVPQAMTEPGLYPFPERTYAEARVAQAPGGAGGLAGFLPEGLTDPPTALPDQNALLVKGTPKAVDQFAEIVRLLDVPPKQVNIEVKLINLTQQTTEESGMDVAGRGRRPEFFLNGPAPVGPSVRILGGNIDALLAANRTVSRSNNTAGANVTTTNNAPCVIRAATVIPVVLASVTFDAFGNRHVDYVVDAVATGVELFALPRINSDDSVSMLLRPTFIDATGQVVGPDGSAAPITQEAAVETMVRVPDGETVLLGGFPSSTQALEATGLPVNLRRSRTTQDVQSSLFVTPRIVRLLQP